MTQSPFQRFSKISLLIQQKHSYKNFHLPQASTVLFSKKNYEDLDITNKFQMKPTTEDIFLKILKNIEVSEGAIEMSEVLIILLK